jgi:hypothetical protein
MILFSYPDVENFFFKPYTTQSAVRPVTMASYHLPQQSGHEVNRSPPFTAEVKNQWSYTFTSPTSVHLNGVSRHNFTFTFTTVV